MPRLGAMRIRSERRGSKAEVWIVAKCCTRRKHIYSTTITQHGKAKRQQQLIHKFKSRRRFRFQDQDAFPRDALYAGGVKSRVLETRASETQPAPVARHHGYHYDRSRRR